MRGLWSRGTLNPVCASIGTSAVFPVATRSAFRRLFTLPGGRCVVDSVCFPRAAAGRRAVGMIFRGYIDIPATGIYTFALASDDGAILRIGGRVVVDNDGEHPRSKRADQVALSAGLHPLELRYFDYNGGEIRLVLLGDDGARPPARYPTCSATIREDCIFGLKSCDCQCVCELFAGS